MRIGETARVLLKPKVCELVRLVGLLESKWRINTSAITESEAGTTASETCDVVSVKSGLNKAGSC